MPEQTRVEGSCGGPLSGPRSAVVYVVSGAVFAITGAFVPELLFSWFEGVPFLLLTLWLVHMVVERRS